MTDDLTGTDLEQHQEQRPTPALVKHINDLAPQIARLGVDEQRFTRTLISAAQANKQLLHCTPTSFMAAAFHSAQLGLEPGPLQQVWFIPRRNRKEGTVEVQWMLGYRGQIELARRVGVLVTADIVYRGDHFAERQGSDPLLEHTPSYDDDRGEAYRWYAVARFPDGRTIHRVLDKSDVEARRKKSTTPYKAGAPWFDWYDRMARKSAVRALWSELPADPRLQRAASMDEQVLTLPTVRESRPAIHAGVDVPAGDDRDDSAGYVPTTGDETSGSSTSSEAPEQEPDEPVEPQDARTLSQLRTACGKVGLSKHGSRQDLIDRLAAHEADDDAVDGEVVHDGPPMPPPPEDPDDAPVDAEMADDDQTDEEPTAAQWRERMVRALQGITSEHPKYVPVWARMVDLVGHPTRVPIPDQVQAWAAADPDAVTMLVTETEALAVAWKAENR